MKKISAIFVFVFLLVSGPILAQSKDSVPAKKVIEQGTKGDIIVGKENKKKQLKASPERLQTDSLRKAAPTHSKKKKCKQPGSKS